MVVRIPSTLKCRIVVRIRTSEAPALEEFIIGFGITLWNIGASAVPTIAPAPGAVGIAMVP